ncbi:phosphate acyltransferase, partial [Escherichia coli]|nr:phosphate acyltransferase [Escherichia coli]
VYVYGDCAINPDPTAEQLAEIAIHSDDTAAAFGIEPRVAMLSYSTGTSGAGSDVEKVREANPRHMEWQYRDVRRTFPEWRTANRPRYQSP